MTLGRGGYGVSLLASRARSWPGFGRRPGLYAGSPRSSGRSLRVMLRTVPAFQSHLDGDHGAMTDTLQDGQRTTVRAPDPIARLRELPAGLGAYSAVMSIV